MISNEYAPEGVAWSDLAVGIVIGAAFNSLVHSIVEDIIMPPVGMLVGGADFSNLFVNLSSGVDFSTLAEAEAAGAITINYGEFINQSVSFLITAFAVFILVKAVNRLRESKDTNVNKSEETVSKCPFCYELIHKSATRCPNCTSDLNAS
ncbi:MAG: large conductance mechanosensitive channel protein MscL [Candidatus Campbellbacteria bacterium]|nr:large conductance mechanosensitive channel protein MscL [Candidatus Campbellbacteria bacterium]